MSSIQELKRRIKSAKNIKQITKAMEMVAASKMRKAQAQALSSRPYARKLQSTLQTIATLTSPGQHPLLKDNETGKTLVVLVSTDKSLAGSLNSNLFRGTQEILDSLPENDFSFIIVGQKARRFVLANDYELYAEFSNLPDPLSYEDTTPLSAVLREGYETSEFKSVHVIYMDFVSTLVQKIRHTQLLPATANWEELVEAVGDAVDMPDSESTYVFEPNAQEILNWLVPYYVEMAIYQILLEAKASEHSARMVAMKNASENAGEIIGDLTLSFNKQRQAQITSELLDNTTASLTMNQ